MFQCSRQTVEVTKVGVFVELRRCVLLSWWNASGTNGYWSLVERTLRVWVWFSERTCHMLVCVWKAKGGRVKRGLVGLDFRPRLKWWAENLRVVTSLTRNVTIRHHISPCLINWRQIRRKSCTTVTLFLFEENTRKFWDWHSARLCSWFISFKNNLTFKAKAVAPSILVTVGKSAVAFEYKIVTVRCTSFFWRTESESTGPKTTLNRQSDRVRILKMVS